MMITEITINEIRPFYLKKNIPTALCIVVMLISPNTQAKPISQPYWIVQEIRDYRVYPRLQKAYHYIAEKKYDKARLLLNRSLEIDPQNMSVRKALAGVCMELKDYPCVQQQASVLVEKDEGSAQGYYYMALITDQGKQPDDVVAWSEKAVTKDGLSEEQEFNLVEVELKNSQEAGESGSKKGIGITASQPEDEMGRYIVSGNTQGAMRLYGDYVKKNGAPSSTTAISWANLFVAQGDYKNAYMMVQHLPNEGEALTLKINLLEANGQNEEAAALLRNYSSSDERNNINYWTQLISLCEKTNNNQCTKNALDGASLFSNRTSDYYANLAYQYLSIHDYSSASKQFTKAISKDNTEVNLYIDLGYTQLKEHNDKKAIHSFSSAVDYYADQNTELQYKSTDKAYGLKSEIWFLEKKWSFYFADIIRLDSSPYTPENPTAGFASYAGFGGMQISYNAIKYIGPSNAELSIVSRLLWSNNNQSLTIVQSTEEAALGLRIKPTNSLNLYLSAERIFAIGDDVTDDWLLRATYGFGKGRSWKPSNSAWQSYTAYFDIARLLDSKQNYLVGNLRYGRTYKYTNSKTPMVITPYLTSGAADSDGTTLVDIGAGISLTNWFMETSYSPYKINSQIFLEARQKIFGNSDDTHTIRLGYVFLY